MLSHVQFFVTAWTDCSLPGSSVRGIFHAKILEWVAISFSRGSSGPISTAVFIRKGNLTTDRHTGRKPGKDEGRDQVMHLQGKEG